MPIQSAGYIVHNDQAIWGTGATAIEAWAAFRDACEAGTIFVGEDDGGISPDDVPTNYPGPVVHLRDYHIRAATQALLDEVEAKGGNISWDVTDGIACVVNEQPTLWVRVTLSNAGDPDVHHEEFGIAQGDEVAQMRKIRDAVQSFLQDTLVNVGDTLNVEEVK